MWFKLPPAPIIPLAEALSSAAAPDCELHPQHCEAHSRFAGSRRFHRRIQRQRIGLKRDLVMMLAADYEFAAFLCVMEVEISRSCCLAVRVGGIASNRRRTALRRL